jgi:hypothetical protein
VERVNPSESNQIDADEEWPSRSRGSARGTKKEDNPNVSDLCGLMLRVPSESDQIQVDQSKSNHFSCDSGSC